MGSLYFLALVVSLGCLFLVDKRYRLAWFYSRRRTTKTLLIGVGFFIVWDAIGVWRGIFATGESSYIMRLFLAANFPIEELFFLTLLMYNALLLYRWLEVRK